jgi:hypothetical protein
VSSPDFRIGATRTRSKSRRLGIKELPTPDGIIEKRLLSFLTAGLTRSIPQKLSTNLRHFPAFRYKSELQTNLRALAELLLEDVVSTEAIAITALVVFHRELTN